MVITILVTNDFQRRGAKTSDGEGFGTCGDEDYVVVMRLKPMPR